MALLVHTNVVHVKVVVHIQYPFDTCVHGRHDYVPQKYPNIELENCLLNIFFYHYYKHMPI